VLVVAASKKVVCSFLSDMGFLLNSVTMKPTSNVAWKCVCISFAGIMVSLIAACWPGYQLTDLAYCKNCRQAYSRLLAWLIVAYWPGCLCLTNQAYCLLLDWLTGLVNCSLLIRLIVAYWPDYLRLTGRAYWPDYLRLIELAYFGLLA